MAAFVVPRIVPPRWRMPETLAMFMRRTLEWTRPSKPSSIPDTSHPNPTEVLTSPAEIVLEKYAFFEVISFRLVDGG